MRKWWKFSIRGSNKSLPIYERPSGEILFDVFLFAPRSDLRYTKGKQGGSWVKWSKMNVLPQRVASSLLLETLKNRLGF
jgi:hypothetical protein